RPQPEPEAPAPELLAEAPAPPLPTIEPALEETPAIEPAFELVAPPDQGDEPRPPMLPEHAAGEPEGPPSGQLFEPPPAANDAAVEAAAEAQDDVPPVGPFAPQSATERPSDRVVIDDTAPFEFTP